MPYTVAVLPITALYSNRTVPKPAPVLLDQDPPTHYLSSPSPFRCLSSSPIQMHCLFELLQECRPQLAHPTPPRCNFELYRHNSSRLDSHTPQRRNPGRGA